MHLLTCAFAVALLVSLAGFDLAKRRLPDRLVGAVALFYFFMAVSARVPPMSIAIHVAVALAVFCVATGLFAAGLLGGGDVKFAAAVFLWAGAKLAVPAFVLISLAGLVVALAALSARWLVSQLRPGAVVSVAMFLSAARGVPYGVAIAFGGLPIVVRTLAGGMTL